jgi:hypothetical protein
MLTAPHCGWTLGSQSATGPTLWKDRLLAGLCNEYGSPLHNRKVVMG